MVRVFVLLLLVNQSVSNKDFKEIKFGMTESYAVSQLVEDFYISRTSILLITKSVFYQTNRLKQLDVINEILYRTNSKIAAEIEDFMFLSSAVNRFYNLLFIDSYEGFL